MKFEEFKSGNYKQQYQYKSFLPASINHGWYWEDPRINVLLEKATKALGELNAFTLIVPVVEDCFTSLPCISRPIWKSIAALITMTPLPGFAYPMTLAIGYASFCRRLLKPLRAVNRRSSVS